METLLAVVVVALFPCLTLLALLGFATRVEGRRAAVIARQIELTDAIHREVGALVAPWVTRRLWGGWRVRIAVPFERPAVVETCVAVVHRMFTERFDLVLTPQENAVRRGPRPLREVREGRSVSWA
jgi:hypothetical protein